jgi:hypothetical protein
VSQFIYWEDFTDRLDAAAAGEIARRFQSVDHLLAFHHAGARWSICRVDRLAVSSGGPPDLAHPVTAGRCRITWR